MKMNRQIEATSKTIGVVTYLHGILRDDSLSKRIIFQIFFFLIGAANDKPPSVIVGLNSSPSPPETWISTEDYV